MLTFRLAKIEVRGVEQWWVLRDDGSKFPAQEDVIALWMHLQAMSERVQALEKELADRKTDLQAARAELDKRDREEKS